MYPKNTQVQELVTQNTNVDQLRQWEEMNSSTTSSPYPGSLTCGDLFENSEHYHKICAPLYKASMRGDWEAAKAILDKHQDIDLVAYGLNLNYDTALHIVASNKSSKAVETFVQNIVNKMTSVQLELKNAHKNTALCLAATAGNVKAVMTMLEKNPALAGIPGSQEMMPLSMASSFGDSEMVNYLYDRSGKMSGDYWTLENRSSVLEKCVEADIFDVAMRIVSDWPGLATNGDLLAVLARKTDAFIETKPCFIWRIIRPIFRVIDVKIGAAEEPRDAMKLLTFMLAELKKLPTHEIYTLMKGAPDSESPETSAKAQESVIRLPNLWRGHADEEKIVKKTYSSRVLFVAAKMGNTEFVVEVIRQYPDLIWKVNDSYQTIIHVAVIHRHLGIYNLVHEIGSMKDMITPLKDINGNNMLHLVGRRAKKNRFQNDSGVGLQMQRELLWFKEVEALLPPILRERKNNDGLTPHELFMEQHKDLLSSNEKWMKDTANQCLVVATLIASIAFAASFGVPGGYDQNTGIPMFLHNQSFMVFAIADAISLAFSSISILIFLSIFISRYSELDFLESLPRKLMAGLATLFFSITAMLVGFCVSFFVIIQGKFIWVPIIITIVISIPVILYARLQYNLLGDVYHSKYASKLLFRPKEHRLFYENPRF